MAAETPKPTDDKSKTPGEAGAAPKGGGKPWLPLVLNVVLMPAIAYALTVFVLIPKIQGGKSNAHGGEEHAEEAAGGAHGGAPAAAAAPAHGAAGKAGGKSKVTVPLGGKVLVNVSGTAGTRYLVTTMSLVGKNADLKTKVEANDSQLRDAAMNILGGKTINDLEKPGMRNIIRSELVSAFNDIVGKEAVSDIYFTEFAIQ